MTGNDKTIKRLRSRIKKLEKLIWECPLGFVDDRVVTHRSITEKDVVEWIRKLRQSVENHRDDN